MVNNDCGNIYAEVEGACAQNPSGRNASFEELSFEELSFEELSETIFLAAWRR